MPRLRLLFRRTTISQALVLATVLVVVIATVLGGLATIFTIRHELERQVWLRVEDAQASTQALYASERLRLESLIALIAQRPTLCKLVGGALGPPLSQYLQDIRDSSDLDSIFIHLPGNQTVGSVDPTLPSLQELMTHGELPFTDFFASENPPRVTLISLREILPTERCISGEGAYLVAARVIDTDFMQSLEHHTGLAQSLLVGDNRVASSLPSVPGWPFDLTAAASVQRGEGACCTLGSADERSYYLGLAPVTNTLGDVVAVSEVALPSEPIEAGERRTITLLTIVGVGMAFIGFILATELTRLIARPLTKLAAAASLLSPDEMDVPFDTDTGLVEINQLARHLEFARQNLRSAQQDARQEKDRVDQLLGAIRDGVMALDGAGQITFFNTEAEHLLGRSAQEVIGCHYHQLFPPAPGETITLHDILHPSGGSPHPNRLTILDAEGRPITLAVSTSQTSLSGTPRQRQERVLVMRDVSEEVAANELRSNFLANVSHELRTPLSAVVAVTELLLEDGPNLATSELEKLSNTIRMSTLQLQTLVDNLLESATIEAGFFRVRRRLTRLEDIIQEATRTMDPLLERRNQRLLRQIPVNMPSLNADPDRMVQVLVNLIANASKFAPMGTTIELSAQVEVKRDIITVSVIDSGPGLPAGRFSDLFRRFATSDRSPKARYGAGLGLSVVKAIVEAHGGEVGAENLPYKGARVWFTLPIAGAMEL